MTAPFQFIVTVNADNADAFAALVAGHLRAAHGAAGAGDIVDAKSSGLTEYEFRQAVRSGALVGSKVGRRYVARRADLDAYLAKKRVTSPPTEPVDVPGDEFDRAVARTRGR